MYAAPPKSFDPDHARVLVVGPMAAGKTSLVHSLCHGGTEGASRPPPTIGCNVDVKLLERGRADRSLEFWDVGGNPDAALARGMFFKDSDAAGVLLVYDVSNPRSLRELRTWADELASAGIRMQSGRISNYSGGSSTSRRWRGGAGGGDANTAGGGFSGGDISSPLRNSLGLDEAEALANLEGGSSGGGGGGGSGGLPSMVVGTKDDLGEGVRREGARLAEELGAGHVVVCARKLTNEEPFESFFSDVFRHHSGRCTPGEGEAGDGWGAERHYGQHHEEEDEGKDAYSW